MRTVSLIPNRTIARNAQGSVMRALRVYRAAKGDGRQAWQTSNLY